jgi:hypothetical protein
MYYIYHIPNFKWKNGRIGKIGCTENIKQRIREQKYSEYEILETHTDIQIVSDREIELQKQYGYPVDTIPYWKTRKMDVYKGGQSAVLSGQLASIRKKGNDAYSKKYSKPVVVYKTNGEFVGEFPSAIESARKLNLNRGNVGALLIGRQKTCKGYVIKYK